MKSTMRLDVNRKKDYLNKILDLKNNAQKKLVEVSIAIPAKVLIIVCLMLGGQVISLI